MKLEVRLARTGGEVTVGHLLDKNATIFFQYDESFLQSALELSPFKLPLRPGVHSGGYPDFHGLYGVFNDALPDGWGLLLMPRKMRERGLDPHRISVLHWLGYIGDRAMGALTFRPAEAPPAGGAAKVSLVELAGEAEAVYEGKTDEVLPGLELAGGSPGGARPKVAVAIDRAGSRMVAGAHAPSSDYEHWLVKFAARDELADAAGLEETYARVARHAGLVVPETRLYGLDRKRRAFGIKRFDRIGDDRVHMHTLGGLVHANHRIPSMDYDDLLRFTGLLTRSQKDVERAFRWMVFNAIMFNRDDHVKNFSFLMSDEGEWSLSPSYDLTYSTGVRGYHTTSFLGEALKPVRTHLLRLAEKHSIPSARAEAVIEQVLDASREFAAIGRRLKLDARTRAFVQSRLDEIRPNFERAIGTQRPAKRKKATVHKRRSPTKQRER